MTMFTMKFLTDLAERVLSTFLFTAIGVIATAPDGNVFDTGLLRLAAAAGIGAACSAIKGVIASRVGDRGSAALLPAGPSAG